MTEFSAADYQHMARAMQLAYRGQFTTSPNPNVGCVIIGANQEYAEGWHEKAGEPHAEINALAQIDNTEGSTCYVTLEPCCHQGKTGPCVKALIKAKVKKVVVAMQDPNPQVAGKGIHVLEDAGIEVSVGLLEQQANALNKGFIKRMKYGLPFVRCKQAISIDARTALHNGESQWITSDASRRDVHKLRALSDAIITGSETVIKDNPSLTVREFDVDFVTPLRVVIDRRLRISVNAKICDDSAKTIIFTEEKDLAKREQFAQVGVEIVCMQEVTPELVLKLLGKEYQINYVMIEAGAELNGAFMRAGLIDELIVYQANKLMGNDARAMMQLPMLNNMQEVQQLKMIDSRHFRADMRFTYEVLN